MVANIWVEVRHRRKSFSQAFPSTAHADTLITRLQNDLDVIQIRTYIDCPKHGYRSIYAGGCFACYKDWLEAIQP